jgi:hypothetical protein
MSYVLLLVFICCKSRGETLIKYLSCLVYVAVDSCFSALHTETKQKHSNASNFPYKSQIKLQFVRYDPEVNSCNIYVFLYQQKQKLNAALLFNFNIIFPTTNSEKVQLNTNLN